MIQKNHHWLKGIAAVTFSLAILYIVLNSWAANALEKYYNAGLLLQSDFHTLDDSGALITFRPNLNNHYHDIFKVNISTNAVGYRTKPFAPPSGKRRLVLLGDSIAFGVFLTEEENLAAQTEKAFREQGQSIEVFNLGIPTCNMRQYAAAFRHFGAALQPEIVVLQAEPGDFLEPPILFLKPWVQYNPILTWLSFRMRRHQEFTNSTVTGLAAYRELLASCANKNIPLVVLYFPFLIENPYDDTWRRDKLEFEQSGVTVVDVAALLARVNPDLTTFRVLPNDPIHPNAKAINIVADQVGTILATTK